MGMATNRPLIIAIDLMRCCNGDRLVSENGEVGGTAVGREFSPVIEAEGHFRKSVVMAISSQSAHQNNYVIMACVEYLPWRPPSLGWLYPGDWLFLLSFWGSLLMALIRELRFTWDRQAKAKWSISKREVNRVMKVNNRFHPTEADYIAHRYQRSWELNKRASKPTTISFA